LIDILIVVFYVIHTCGKLARIRECSVTCVRRMVQRFVNTTLWTIRV